MNAVEMPMADYGQVPLSRFPLFRSTDLDETRAEVGRVFCTHRLNPLNARSQLNAEQNRVIAGSAALNFLRYGTAVRIEPGELETFFLVQIPLRGSARVSCGAEDHVASPREASVLSPTGQIKMEWSDDCEQLIVWVQREAAERHLAGLLGSLPNKPLRFQLAMPLDRPQGQSWLRTARYFAEEFDSDYSWLHTPTAMAQFERTVITALLYAQPHNYSEQLHHANSRLAPAIVRHAEAYMQRHVHTDVTVKEVAEHVGVSVRTLQVNFSRFRSASPLQYLRELRLTGVRRDLLAAKDEETVTEIALRWRFTELGRFAHIYRQRFDELPSQTKLQRAYDGADCDVGDERDRS